MKKNTPQTPVKLSNLELFTPSSKNAHQPGLKLFALLLLATISSQVSAQDPQFTQFFANPLYLNPAFTGSTKCSRLVMNYRNEWPALSGTFITSSVSYDQPVDALDGGLGLLITHDKAGGGTLNTISSSFLYSYYTEIGDNFSIRAGFQVGYMQKRLNWEKLTFGDMIDPRYGFIYETAETKVNNTKGNLDISTGMVGYSKKYFGGIAVHHLTQPGEGFIDQDNARLPFKISIHAGAIIPLDEQKELKFAPNIVFQQQQDFQQLNLGFYLRKGPLYGGLWYRQAERNSDSFILLTGIQMGDLRFGYSYDITLSRLSTASAGSHELSTIVKFGCNKPKTKRWKEPPCFEWN
ncbi:MAG: type IX secretion system membrane protein PorP/SprF [Flavobacteriales bacterium]|nr:type IX secretion system membrane protein PorP/SprF [Flavobacteriales bacterium]